MKWHFAAISLFLISYSISLSWDTNNRHEKLQTQKWSCVWVFCVWALQKMLVTLYKSLAYIRSFTVTSLNVRREISQQSLTWWLVVFLILYQVLRGDIEEAICSHALYYKIWQRYNSLPERFNWNLKAPDVRFYPLRPEFVESTYLLYQVYLLGGFSSPDSNTQKSSVFLPQPLLLSSLPPRFRNRNLKKPR